MKTKMLRVLLLLALAFSVLAPTITARAATVTVTNTNDGGVGSLRNVIAATAPGDTITFDPALSGGTIRLATSLILNQNVTIDGSSLAARITLSGDTDGNGTGDVGVFVVNSGVTATLNNLTITKGNAADGGGIVNSGTLTVLNSVFTNNSASGYGGGIDSNGTLTVTNSTFSGNSADTGGGIDNYGAGIATISNSTFSTNSAIYYGGGINNESTMTITNSTLNSNAAASGGGIENYNAALIVANGTFYSNTASDWGGGIENNSTLTVTNSTFSNNSSTKGGGGIDNFGSSGTLNFANTILANSPAGGDCLNTATLGTNTNTLVEDGGCYASVTGDPKLGSLANNGGPTQTMSLLSGSPAIDAANDAVCAAAPINNLDQRGIARPLGVHCDIGSYELVADSTPPTVISITRASPNPTNAASVNFTVTFSEPVTGVDTAAPFNDFGITTSGAGITGAAVSAVSGSGSVYTVTVSTGTGSGTIRLDVSDNDSIMDLASNPLGGAGLGNGDFTGGEVYTAGSYTIYLPLILR
jgi:predicted outer membrane repeat protein